MQAFVDSASPIYIIDGATKIKTNYLANNALLDGTNPLGIDAIDAVKNHFNLSVSLTNDQVNTYLAASALLHSLDGWLYLSHAVESLLKGDQGIAIHLAYYAELRATMSFLSAEGIGIFNNRHLCVDSINTIKESPVKRGTHEFTWEVIEKWANSTTKANSELLQVFSVNGKTFEEWVNACPYASITSANLITQRWLKKWNFDVQFFKNDRDNRNTVSYRPQRIQNNPSSKTLNEIINNLNSCWDLLCPNESNRFQILDKYLLKLLLQELYDSFPQTTKTAISLEAMINQALDNLGSNHDESLVNFLKDTSAISHVLFTEAANNSINPTTYSQNAMSVIARATLMLRMSTANVSLIYKKAGITKSELDFLWENFGLENGFWESGGCLTDFESLWLDIKDDIEEVVNWANNLQPTLCLSKVYNDNDVTKAFNYFKQFHRAALWGMAI